MTRCNKVDKGVLGSRYHRTKNTLYVITDEIYEKGIPHCGEIYSYTTLALTRKGYIAPSPIDVIYKH